MFYLITIITPIVLILVVVVLKKPKSLISFVDVGFYSIYHIVFYYFVLYFLESEKYLTGWYSLSYSMFAVIYVVIVVVLKIIFWIMSLKKTKQ